ncbi:MAG: hypothetical protein RIR10_415, partial [Planctomycetota bacterium]
MFAWHVVETRESSHDRLLRKRVVPHDTTSGADVSCSGFAALR